MPRAAHSRQERTVTIEMRGHGRTIELGLRLRSVDDLFRTPDPQCFRQTGRLHSGVDELMVALRVERLPARVRTTISFTGEVASIDDDELRRSVQEYCGLRLRDLDLELRAHRREERQSLTVGGVLFLLGIGLSAEFTQSFWPAEVQSLLGDGIFLVLAWVGLWYPLDYFIFGRRPLLLDRKVLQAIRGMEITTRVDANGAELTSNPAPPQLDTAQNQGQKR
jgi:hypothetical protein